MYSLIFVPGVFILAVCILRMVFKNRIKSTVFLLFWVLVFIKLLIPIEISSPLSIYNVLDKINSVSTVQQPMEKVQEVFGTFPIVSDAPVNNSEDSHDGMQTVSSDVTGKTRLFSNTYFIIWLVGALVVLLLSIFVYHRELKKIAFSLQKINNPNISKILSFIKLKRTLKVYLSEQVTTPLTYGFLNPIIVLPNNIDLNHKKSLLHILLHEGIHIKRFDIILKYLGIISICIHWYNPLVWLAFHSFCLDLETSCDEMVIDYLGEKKKSEYAMSLIRIARERISIQRSYEPSLLEAFARRPVQERVLHIMKYKKIKLITLVLYSVLTIGTVTSFATTKTTDQKFTVAYDSQAANKETFKAMLFGFEAEGVRVYVDIDKVKEKVMMPDSQEAQDELVHRGQKVLAEAFPSPEDVKNPDAFDKAEEALGKEFSITNFEGINIQFYVAQKLIIEE